MTKDVSGLVNLRHFVAENDVHSSVPEFGKMKCLQEMKTFCVKKESVGFEINELGKLIELDETRIYPDLRAESHGNNTLCLCLKKHFMPSTA